MSDKDLEDDDDGKPVDIPLSVSPDELRRPARVVPQRVVRKPEVQRPTRWPWFLVLLLLAGGAALERTEHGAFFRHKIDALIHADERALLTQDTIGKVRDVLGADTADRAGEALVAVENAVARAPRHKPLLGYAAYALFAHELRFGRDAGRHAKASEWLTRAGDHPHAFLAGAARDVLLNEPDKARAGLARAPHEVETKLLLGAIELATKHPLEAIAALEEAVKLEAHPRTQAALARAVEQVDATRAAVLASAVAESAKTHVGARLILARLAYRAYDSKGLTQWVAELGMLDKQATESEKSELFALRGLHAIDRGELVAARAAFDESGRLAKGVPSSYALVGLGDLDMSAGKLDEARARYDAAIVADPTLTRARLGLANALIALGKLDDARGVLDAIADPAAAAEVTKLRAKAAGKPKKK